MDSHIVGNCSGRCYLRFQFQANMEWVVVGVELPLELPETPESSEKCHPRPSSCRRRGPSRSRHHAPPLCCHRSPSWDHRHDIFQSHRRAGDDLPPGHRSPSWDHQQLGGEGRKGRGGDRSKTGVAAPTARKGMDWLWWRDRLALARAATIWRTRSDQERDRPVHTRSAMKRLKLSVRVSHAFRRLGNAARVVSWGRNAFLLSPINLLAMSAFLLRCPSN